MEHKKQPKIEAIFPLSYMQQGLLFHHLSSDWDQGFLHMECTLKGDLYRTLFEKSWQQIAQRHPVLRTTIEWEGLEKPVQITHGHKPLVFSYHNWDQHSVRQRALMLEELKEADRESSPRLRTGPLSHIILIKIDEKEHIFLWPSHHLLIDGWSSNSILKEVLQLYNAQKENKEVIFETLPSQRSYLNWLKEIDAEKGKAFWSGYFESFRKELLFNDSGPQRAISKPKQYELQLSPELSKHLSNFTKDNAITGNTLLQAAWAFLLALYFGEDDVVFGTTVSGRSGDFPNLQLLSGMFMNIQPVRASVANDLSITEWMSGLQKQQVNARKYEHLSLDQVTDYFNWPSGRLLFDSLLIFENFPITKAEGRSLEAVGIKSGITSTFPVTLVVVPGDKLQLKLSVLPEIIDESIADWILKAIEQILNAIISHEASSFTDIRATLDLGDPPKIKNISSLGKKSAKKFEAPRNETEIRLVQIWETAFGRDRIGVHDNFFDLGGKSLMAVRMFTTINSTLKQKLPPTAILESPTIAQLANVIQIEKEQTTTDDWKNLVPIKAGGSKRPLFCLHAGGGHVFFYGPLASSMEEDRPVYALQPSGIFGQDEFHQSIEEMAVDYVEEIQKVQKNGPYNILVYCFSTALGLEMSKIFSGQGEHSNLIIMDTMTDQDQLLTKQRFSMRFHGFMKRIFKNPLEVARLMIATRVHLYIKPAWIGWFGNAEQKNADKIRIHLEKIYNNYQWEIYPGEVTLILTPKADKRFNEELIRSWSQVATGGVKVTYTQGKHRSIFEKPDVVFAAKVVDECCV